MSHFGRGYAQLERTMLDVAYDGLAPPAAHHALLSMFLLADASTATWRGSAPALSTILGYVSKNTMAEALDVLGP